MGKRDVYGGVRVVTSFVRLKHMEGRTSEDGGSINMLNRR